ncbi:MAG: NUDIX hydrolase [Ahrensia sp.]|nr:NUDIX hydrolase [Ahrensia sp.]
MTLDSDGVADDVALEIDVIEKRDDFKGFRAVETFIYRETVSGLQARREIVRTQHAVAVVAYDPKLDRLVMIRQFRIGAQLAHQRGFCTEVVAGLIDPGEDAHTTAARELEEETGLSAIRVEKLCEFLTTPGMTDELLHLYYAQVDASSLSSESGVGSETEQTFPFTLTLEDALAAVDEGRITNGIAMIALFQFTRHRERLLGMSS